MRKRRFLLFKNVSISFWYTSKKTDKVITIIAEPPKRKWTIVLPLSLAFSQSVSPISFVWVFFSFSVSSHTVLFYQSHQVVNDFNFICNALIFPCAMDGLIAVFFFEFSFECWDLIPFKGKCAFFVVAERRQYAGLSIPLNSKWIFNENWQYSNININRVMIPERSNRQRETRKNAWWNSLIELKMRTKTHVAASIQRGTL